MNEKLGQQAAHRAPGVSTISLHPRHSGGSTASSSVRPALAQVWTRRRGIDPRKPAKCAGRMAAPLSAVPLCPYIQGVTGPDPLLVFDRTTLRRRRERAARRWDRHAFLKREIAERLVDRLD